MRSIRFLLPLCCVAVFLFIQSCARHATCSAYSGKLITPNRTYKHQSQGAKAAMKQQEKQRSNKSNLRKLKNGRVLSAPKYSKTKRANGERTTRYKYVRSRRFKFKSPRTKNFQRTRAKF